MLIIRRISNGRWWYKKKKNWILFVIFLFLVFVRVSKGSIYKDFYFFISRPFWPGQFQKEIVLESIDQEYSTKLNLLEKDNIRLRRILSLQEVSNNNISAAVISRKTGSWWRQIILNKGSKDGVEIGNVVVGPGGLLGRVNNTSLLTSSVTLITSPESKLGVWLDRIQINGLLVGLGDDFPSLIIYSKDADIKVGDFVSSSPASSLLPPNIPIGVVQSIDKTLKSKKTAKFSLFAKPHVIDWVQILKVNI